MNFHITTPTGAKAIARHRAFHQAIEHKAAELQSSKLLDALKVQRQANPPLAPHAIAPEAIPAEPDPPKQPDCKQPVRMTRAEMDVINQAKILAALHAVEAAKLASLRRQLERSWSDIRKLMLIVGHHFDVTDRDILSNRREKIIVYARQMAMFLCRDFTTLSYPEIGRRLGGRDHTTVLHAFRKFDAIMRLPDGYARGIVSAHACGQLRADVAMFRQKIVEMIPTLQRPTSFRHLTRSPFAA